PDEWRPGFAPIVVFDTSLTLLLFGEPDVEVGIECGSEAGRPREPPSHSLLLRLQLRERSARHRAERDVVIREVNNKAVEAVRDRRAGRAPCCVLRPEHEVVHEEL